MYAAGRDSPKKLPCQQLLKRVVIASRLKFCTNSEVLQEILHRYTAIGAQEVGFRIFDNVFALGLIMFAVEADDVVRAKSFLIQIPTLSTRDAVHLGVMQGHGVRKIASYDRGFSAIDWVERIEPH